MTSNNTDNLNRHSTTEAADTQIEKVRSIEYLQDTNSLIIKQGKQPQSAEDMHTIFGTLPDEIEPDAILANAITVFNVKEINIGGFGEPAHEILSHANEVKFTENTACIKFDPRHEWLNPFIQFEYKGATQTRPAYLNATVTYEQQEDKETL